MRKSRVLLAGVAVAAAAAATSAFTASNDFTGLASNVAGYGELDGDAVRTSATSPTTPTPTTASSTTSSSRTDDQIDAGAATMGLTAARRCRDHRWRPTPVRSGPGTPGPTPRSSRAPSTRPSLSRPSTRSPSRSSRSSSSEWAGRPRGRPARPGTGALAMNAATRAASISAVAALVLAAVWLFWPAALGGGTTFVTTHGISMEPRFSTGDLAILRPDHDSSVGDVVAYRSDSLDTLVMHRIVARDGDRFVLQGDNNDWLDAEQPAQDQILGSLFLRVPQGGKALAALTSPGSLVVVAGAAVAVLGAARAPRRHKRRAGRARTAPSTLDADPGARPAGGARAPQPSSSSRRSACGVLLLLPATQTDTAHRRGHPAGPVLLHRRRPCPAPPTRRARSPPGTPSGRGSPGGLTVSFTNTVSGPDLAERGRRAAARRGRHRPRRLERRPRQRTRREARWTAPRRRWPEWIRTPRRHCWTATMPRSAPPAGRGRSPSPRSPRRPAPSRAVPSPPIRRPA